MNTDKLTEALATIRRMAMQHPCFDQDCFERRDIADLCRRGGDICDWTMIAITADNALQQEPEKL